MVIHIPSLYPLYRGADWPERETFDMAMVLWGTLNPSAC